MYNQKQNYDFKINILLLKLTGNSSTYFPQRSIDLSKNLHQVRVLIVSEFTEAVTTKNGHLFHLSALTMDTIIPFSKT